MSNFYFIGNEEFISFVDELGEYLEVEPKLLKDDVKFSDIVYPYLIPKNDLWGNCQLIAQEDMKTVLFWDNKIYQHDKLKGIVTIPEYYKLPNFRSVNLEDINEPVCISQSVGRGGATSFIYYPDDDLDEIPEKTANFIPHNPCIVSKIIDKSLDLANNIVIFDDGYIFVSQIAGQNIDITKFTGGSYPVYINIDIEEKIIADSLNIGRVMYEDGYRGVAGIDYMLEGDTVYFTEINPRKIFNSFGLSKVMEKEYGMSMALMEYKALIEHDTPKIEKIDEYKGSWSFTIDSNKINFEEVANDN